MFNVNLVHFSLRQSLAKSQPNRLANCTDSPTKNSNILLWVDWFLCICEPDSSDIYFYFALMFFLSYDYIH